MRAIEASTSSPARDIAVGHELGEPGCVVVVEEITHQLGIRPPLTMIVWPDTNAESSERK